MANSNNEFYQNSLINVRKDNDEWKNAAGTCSANLIEKVITENGEYNAKKDGADGYSRVITNVPNTYDFIGMRLPQGVNIESQFMPIILPDAEGTFNCSTVPIGQGYSIPPKIIAAQPVKLIKGSPAPTFEVYFTPTSDFQGFDYNITPTGTTITGGDGYVYHAYIDVAVSPSIRVYKTNNQVVTSE